MSLVLDLKSKRRASISEDDVVKKVLSDFAGHVRSAPRLAAAAAVTDPAPPGGARGSGDRL
jgi:hypothetical protein